jgi:hypothetical protein
MVKHENIHQGIVIYLGRLSLIAATLLAGTPAIAQSNLLQSQTRVMIEYSIPFGIGTGVAHQRPYLGLSVTHDMGHQAIGYSDWARNRISMVDIRFDPQAGSITKFGVGGIEFANRQRVYAMEGDSGPGSSEWSPGTILAGIAVTGGILALLLHEAASVQPPGCTIANVNVCK